MRIPEWASPFANGPDSYLGRINDKDASLETDHHPPTDTFLALDATETDAVTGCACQTDLEGESIESMKME